MAEGFGRWESDPLFSAAEVVQDSADRMESIYRLVLHEQTLLEGQPSDCKFLSSVRFHRRDLMTALETTKWQLEDFERAVHFAALTNTSKSRAHAITSHRQFISAIGEQILQVENNLRNMSAEDMEENQRSLNLNEPEINGLALFLSGSDSADQHLQYDSENNVAKGCCTSTSNSDEIVEIKPECERLNDHSGTNDVEAGNVGDSTTRFFSARSRLRGSAIQFLRKLWFLNLNKLTRTFTKRRKDGKTTNGFILDNDHPLSFGFSITPAKQVYTWSNVALRRFGKPSHLHQYGQNRIWILLTSILLAIVILCLLAVHFG